VQTLDGPTPQPLPGHGAPEPTTDPGVPQPHHTAGMLGLAASAAVIPGVLVATEKFGANPMLAAGIGGVVAGLGALGLEHYRNGPDAPPSPGRVTFDEIVKPHAGALEIGAMAIGGGGALVAGAAMAFAHSADYSPAPQYTKTLMLVGGVAAATFGVGLGIRAIGNWFQDASSGARNH
jgi:hypothetical protein